MSQNPYEAPREEIAAKPMTEGWSREMWISVVNIAPLLGGMVLYWTYILWLRYRP